MLALSFVTLFIFLATKKKETSSVFTGLFLLMPISNIAYYLAATATTAEGYIVAQKLIYVGAIFIPCILLLIIVNFINCKQFNWMVISFGLISTVLYSLVLTIGNNDWYYVSYSIRQAYGVTVMDKVYGKLHPLYFAYMILYVLMIIGFFIYGFKKKSVSYKSLIYLSSLFILSIGSSFISRLWKTFDSTPATYVLSSVVMILLSKKIERYNVSIMTSVSQDNELYYGMIALDNKRNYLGCSEKILLVIPEIKDAKIDFPLPSGHAFDHIDELINAFDSGKHDYYINCKKGDVVLKFSATSYKYSRKHSGYLIEVSNDTKRAEYIDLIKNYNEKLADEVEEKTKHIRAIQDHVTLGMANMIETRDENTGGHVKRTSDIIGYVLESAKKLHVYEIDDEFFTYVKRSAPMHDLGKISISNDVLNKPGKFTAEEFEIMKTHSSMGEKMVSVVLDGVEDERFVRIAKNMAKYHHEKYGGGGYPENLQGDEIPLEARLMALVDVYDALVSKRVYKEKMPFDVASKIIEDSMGSHFDPKLKTVFADCREKLEEYYKANE